MVIIIIDHHDMTKNVGSDVKSKLNNMKFINVVIFRQRECLETVRRVLKFWLNRSSFKPFFNFNLRFKMFSLFLEPRKREKSKPFFFT